MDLSKKSRRATRAQFTRIANLLEASESDAFTPEGEAQYILLEELATKLAVLDSEIEKFLLDKDGDDAELEKELDDVATYKLRWLTIQNARKKPQVGVYKQEERNYKLPRLEQIKFDGNLKSWLPFWAQFEKIHLDQMMNENDKLQYLRQSMTPGTEVSRFIDSYPATSKSYQQAIADLKERYARNDLLTQVYVRELLTLILHKDTNSNSLTCLYDQISTQLRALEILGVTQEGYSSFILPMVESAIPLETLKAWERARPAAMKNELQSLLEFLKKEVESEQRIQLATTAFSQEQKDTPVKESTAAALVAATTATAGSSETKKQVTCLWCDKNHSSIECYKLAKMSLEQRRDHIKKKKACLNCLKIGHNAKVCKSFVQCFICKKRHSVTLCPGTSENTKKKDSETIESSTASNFTSQESTVTLLQTTMVRLVNGDKQMMVRALVDNGSQRSYLRKDVAQKLGLKEAGRETLTHCLFSGVQVRSKVHNIYKISVQSSDKSFSIELAALDQPVICNNLPKFNNSDTNLTRLLGKNNIVLADNDCTEISLLIGADYSGYIMTDTMVVLKDGLIAIKTKLGWVLQGKVENSNNNSTNTLFCSSDISGFWSLELLGIRDPVENKSKIQAEAEAVMTFEESVNTNVDGRYEVSLPLKVGHEELLSNRDVAEKRLRASTKRLMSTGKFYEYHNIICSWETEGIVERVPEAQSVKQGMHYLPHRGVSKDSSMTTKLRPVYDASACDKNNRSLNSYLNKGVNFLDKIPHLLTGFRKGVIGISADIAKAFLQVSVKPSDRDYLRFLWWQDESQTDIVEYRHCRVVFGLTSSPFLLSATIAHHLRQVTGKEKETAEILAKSFYVDNCITSMDSKEEVSKFIAEAKEIMRQAKFDLRQWATSPNGINETSSKIVSILGLMWNTETDELSCNLGNLPNYSELGKITKKDLMSLIQRIFDPIGFTCPVTLLPRLIMQETWRRGLTWDEKLPDDLETEFRKWYEHVSYLGECKIPRRLTNYRMAESTLSLHLFCDASKLAYGACVLLRSEKEGDVSVRILSAKSRVAPPRKASIPRLELTATLIGSRLLAEVKRSLGIKEIEEYCWTDSCVAYYWITKNLPWNVYVHNRVKEIRENTKISCWHHCPGTLNWADVASRGCNAEQLVSLRWWEGPAWLKLPREEWPKSSLHIDGKEACKELQKTKTACNADICVEEGLARLYYFSKYSKIVRMMAWMLRFIKNMQSTKAKKNGEISVVEYEEAEKKIVKLIQRSEEDYIIEQKRSLNTYLDEDGLLRVKTKLLLSDFPESTKSPALLPAKNIIVRRLVEQRHRELQHAGANQLTANIRTRFWIIGIRRLAKSVIAACTVCARFRSKPAQVPTAPLPSERVQCTAPFQVSGVDLAGPLFLREEEKCWVVFFTCAVYRCVHLELTKSLSTEAFMLTLRRFIARRGRVRQFICDNGTNFHGTKNRLAEIDWEEVQKQSTIDHIQWKMNAPTAAWWGGFFERLIRIMKDLLKRILGQSRVNYEELETILCECEAVMNQRPLTYVQDDKNTCLEPLTPACFLQCIPHTDVTDLDTADANSMNSRLKYMLKLRKDFKQRFKNEYLTALVQRGKNNTNNLNIGDIVLIETEEKRIKWPLGVIIEVFIGKDGNYRTAKVKTSSGFKIRPFQRLYPLEMSTKEESDQLQNSQQSSGEFSENLPTIDADSTGEIENISKTETGQTSEKTTRCGRAVKIPSKYIL